MTVEGKKWFLMKAGQVHGPFTADEAEALLPDAVEPLLWGRGMGEWLPPAAWKQAMQTLGTALSEEMNKEEPHWRYRDESGEHGPFSYSDLIARLKTAKDNAIIDVSDNAGPWREVYSYQKIVDELGITRRAHPRVPIMGSLKIEKDDQTFDAKVTTISEGGLGITDSPPLAISERFKASLSSANLFMEIPCTCEVVYVGSDGYTGLRFVSLPKEAEASVIEYVNRFKEI